MYIQALKSFISKFLQVKKMETELLDKGVDKELINNLDHWHLLFITIACFILILTIYKSRQ